MLIIQLYIVMLTQGLVCRNGILRCIAIAAAKAKAKAAATKAFSKAAAKYGASANR